MSDPTLYPTAPKNKSKTKRVDTKNPAADAAKQQQSLADQARADALAAEARAKAERLADKRKAGRRFVAGAANLEGQARALEDALKNQFGKNLRSNLADVGKNLRQQTLMLTDGAKARGAQFVATARDNEKATADALEGSAQNMVRERADAVAQLLQHGAGETDSMRAMLMAARNMQANAGEANRSYYDTVRSVNSGLTDLKVDTKTALQNMYGAAEQEKDRLWSDFYNRRSEAFTQYGNIRGQQADYLEQAKEMGVKVSAKANTGYEAKRDAAFAASAKEMGKDYKQARLPSWVRGYKGTPKVEERQSNTNLAAAVTLDKAEKAEGASLRRWEG